MRLSAESALAACLMCIKPKTRNESFCRCEVLKPEFSTDATFVKKFRVEAQSAAGLSHPNIVNVYDVGEEDGIYYIVMELVRESL